MPDIKTMENNPKRFALHVLDLNNILEALNGMYDLLVKFGHPDFKILLSVSPVPLHLTYRKRDIFCANSYSKSLLRCAAEIFCAKHDNVDYFPSYESIILSEKKSVWQNDQRHVTKDIVRFNVIRMTNNYINPNTQNYQNFIHSFRKTNPIETILRKKLGPVIRKFKNKLKK